MIPHHLIGILIKAMSQMPQIKALQGVKRMNRSKRAKRCISAVDRKNN